MEENLTVAGMGPLRAHGTPRQPATQSPAHGFQGPSSHADAECLGGRKTGSSVWWACGHVAKRPGSLRVTLG